MKNYNTRIALHLLFIFVNMVALAYILPDDRLPLSKIILGFVLVVQIVLFLNFFNSIYRTMANMIGGLRNRDFTLSFQKTGFGRSIDSFYVSLSELMREIKEERTEDAARLQYLNMAFEEIDAGIISVRDENEVILINARARELLGLESLNSWEQLKIQQPEFYNKVNALRNVGSGMITLHRNSLESRLSVSVNPLRFLNHDYIYITFKDIRDELEKTEFGAWQKLIRILTHEIMNSVTPVSSMAENMAQMIDRMKPESPISKETVKDLAFSAETIRRRSDGLLEFVDNYRNLTRVPAPKIIPNDVEELINSVLLVSENYRTKITFIKEIILGKINLDATLIEQVLINLIKNSVEAIPPDKEGLIHVRVYLEDKWNCISVSDNGEGIPEAEKKEVFVPFFTTKKAGSGIGLSLSKQIMVAHRGHITLESTPGKGTTVTLLFPK